MSLLIFGYGSLVNPATHSFEIVDKVSVTGQIREWVTTPVRDHAFLSLSEHAKTTVPGVIMRVPEAAQDDLDRREALYERHDLGHACPHPAPVVTYRAVKPKTDAAGHILLSYLDCVIKGYLDQFGQDAARVFFTTTRNWHVPVLNDRADPKYPRSVILTKDEQCFVDDQLAAISATVI